MKKILLNILGATILSFGIFNIHSLSGVTEGGILGAGLLFWHLFKISPAISSFLLNAVCYILGWRVLGKEFVKYSIVAATTYSVTYAIFERIGPLFPKIAEYPLLAALIGAIFVGVGAGLCVRCDGAPSGDDALSMSISNITGLGIQWIYLISDLIVLGLSLLYIPLSKILYSLLTVIISGQIIGLFSKKSSDKCSDESERCEH